MAEADPRSGPDETGAGFARCPGPSTRDIVHADAKRPPAGFMDDSYAFLGDADVSYDVYTSTAIAAREAERMWSRTWQMACRLEEIPRARDHIVYDIGDASVIVVRQDDGGVKAFVNSCRHRGMQLAASGARGHAAVLRCPFHGWSWSVEGELKSVPCRWDFPHVSKESHALDPVHVAQWGGFVFVNLAEDPEPFADVIEPLAAMDLPIPFEDRHITYHVQKVLPANWKLSVEAFLEAYHVLATHPEGLAAAGDANCQYDVYGRHVSRFIHTIGFRSPHLAGDHDETAMFDILAKDADLGPLPEGARARDAYSEHLRATLAPALGVDLQAVSTTQLMDSIEYFVFPNFMVFPGITLPMVYRFRPVPEDVDRSIFDLWFLAPTPPGGETPPAPEPVLLDEATPFTRAPGMDARLAFIYEQDVDNLARLTRGIKASRKLGQTLGNYQEVRIRHMRRTLAEYLA